MDKNKFGDNMKVMWDDFFQFICINIKGPGNKSDYMAWFMSDLYITLKPPGNNLLISGLCWLCDNAYITTPYSSVPVTGAMEDNEYAYIFYHS